MKGVIKMNLEFPISRGRRVVWNRIRKAIIAGAILMALQCGGWMEASAKDWEPVKIERTDTKSVAKEAEFEIKTASQMIIVASNHHLPVKVFTILGRLVSHETLPPGRSQMQLPAHGVYIVKVGDTTYKVAV